MAGTQVLTSPAPLVLIQTWYRTEGLQCLRNLGLDQFFHFNFSQPWFLHLWNGDDINVNVGIRNNAWCRKYFKNGNVIILIFPLRTQYKKGQSAQQHASASTPTLHTSLSLSSKEYKPKIRGQKEGAYLVLPFLHSSLRVVNGSMNCCRGGLVPDV